MHVIIRPNPIKRSSRWRHDDYSARAVWRGVRSKSNYAALDDHSQAKKTKNKYSEVAQLIKPKVPQAIARRTTSGVTISRLTTSMTTCATSSISTCERPPPPSRMSIRQLQPTSKGPGSLSSGTLGQARYRTFPNSALARASDAGARLSRPLTCFQRLVTSSTRNGPAIEI